MRYDLYSLDLFVAVAEAGSLAGAAKRRNMAASAVSKRMSDLERVIGAPLFYRQRRGIELTAAGIDLLRHAKALQQTLGRMEAEMSDFADGVHGTIRVAANTSSITQFLPEDIAAFVDDNPNLRVQLIEQTSADVLDSVRAGHVDIGIYSGFNEAVGLQTALYRRDTLVVAVPDDHRLATRPSVTFRDVLGEDFVALQQGSSIQAYLERRAEDLGGQMRTRVQVMSFDGVRRMVEARLGIAILPFGAVEPYLETSRLAMLSINESWANRDLRLAFKDPALLTAQTRALLRSLVPSFDGTRP